MQSTTVRSESRNDRILRWVIKELRNHGFEIRRNYFIEVGEVSHRLNVLAILSPITGVELKLGVVVVNKDIGPEEVEKFFTWKQEGELDKIVAITIGKVAIEAYELAKRFGVDLVRVGRDVEVKYADVEGGYNIFHVHPIVQPHVAVETLRKLAKGFLKKRKELVSVVLVYVPFMDLHIEARLHEEETEEIKEVKLSFEALRGAMVDEEGDTLKVLSDKGSFAEFSDTALDILRILVRDNYKSADEMAMELKLGEGKIRSIANYLLHKGLVDIYQDILEFRKSLLDNYFSVTEFLSSRKAKIHDGEPPDIVGKGKVALYPRINIERLLEFIYIFSRRINSLSLIYYPFYIGSIKESSGNLKKVVLDGVTGVESSSILWALTDAEDVIDEASSLSIS